MAFNNQLASMAIFCPQSKAPTAAYLNGIWRFMVGHEHLTTVLEQITKLSDTWSLFASNREDVASLGQGPRYLKMLADWATTGNPGQISGIMSGILSLTLLVAIQICQYFQYLRAMGISHSEFLDRLRQNGGLQGYCGGLPAAAAIACSKDEAEVVKNIGIAMRLALGIGAYGELGDQQDVPGPTTIVVRLKSPNQGEELIKQFPGAYISAVTDLKTISIVGPVEVLARIQLHVERQGLQTQSMHIRGKVHNPENTELAQELCELSDREECLRLPNADSLLAPVRSNRTGMKLKDGSLSHELISTILASRCEWYTLLLKVAEDLDSTGTRCHIFATFGIGDCTPLSPFHKLQLKIQKIDVLSFLTAMDAKPAQEISSSSCYEVPSEAIAIIGASCRLPGANNLEELWEILSTGASQCVELSNDRFDLHGSFRASQDPKFADKKKFYGNFVDTVADFDHGFFKVNPKEALNMDPQQRMLLQLAYEAMDDSGYLRYHRRDSADSVGCFIGASFVEYLDNTNASPPTAYTSTGTIRAFLCGRLSYYFGWEGPAEVLDTACSSSLVAINRACKAIQIGECEMALTGGINLISGINNFLDLAKAGFLSPTGQCKPFDARADGYCRAEGGGLIVLKNLRQAVSDGDQIYGVIPGISTNQGGLSASITVPHSVAQEKLYRSVLSKAGLRGDQISYVEAHGTGTKVGDPLEVASVRTVFGGPERSNMLHLGSIKGNIGHCETAAGVAGLLKVLTMIRKRQLPPLANHSQLNPSISPLEPDKMCIDTSCEPWRNDTLIACVNSYGAAGSNCALLCSQWPLNPAKEMLKPRPKVSYPIIVSAASKESLQNYAKALESFLRATQPKLDIADVAFTLSERRKRHQHSCSFVVSDIDGLCESLVTSNLSISKVPDTAKRVVIAFSGQSKQTIGMNESLLNTYPQLQKNIKDCNDIIQSLGLPSIMSSLFQPEAIEDVMLLHTGTFAMQYAFAQTWLDSGLQVDAVVGHSFGELCALAVSGVLALHDAILLVATRANLMRSKWGAESGVMLVVHSSVGVVEAAISNVKNSYADTYLEIACFNSPSSQIIVGDAPSIEAVQALLKHDPQFCKVQSQKLDTAYGFHSKFTEPLLDELYRTAQTLTFNRPNISVEACTATHIESIQPIHVRQHTRTPVYFAAAMRRLEERLGPCVWLEAGVNSPIIGMAKKALATPEKHTFLATKDRSVQDSGSPISDMSNIMWQEGVSVSYWSFTSSMRSRYKHVWLPPYQFEHKTHWLPHIDHAIEAQKLGLESRSEELAPKPVSKPARLVTALKASQEDIAEFQVNISTSRFTTIVSGHAVRQRPLCPASMYMECAAEALRLLRGPIEPGSLHFDDLDFQAPLGTNLDRNVIVTLSQRKEEGKSWMFVVKSRSRTDSRSRYVIHGQGTVSLRAKPDLSFYHRMIAESLTKLGAEPGAERLFSPRAYSLFSRVVTYAEFLKGISHIVMDGGKAIATISAPEASVYINESDAISICDTVTIDMFIQVLGLLVNSSSMMDKEDISVATGIDQTSMSAKCNLSESKSWTVYVAYTPCGESGGSGDVFVLDKNGSLVMLIKGVRFKKLRISQLERLLDAANPEFGNKDKEASVALPKSHISSGPTSSTQSNEDSSPELERTDSLTSLDSLDQPPCASHAQPEALRKLLASYSGLDEIPPDVDVRSLGVDSLAAVELAEELQTKFGCDVASDDLLDLSFKALCSLLLPKSEETSAPTGSKQSKPGTSSANKASSASYLKSEIDKVSQTRNTLFEMISEASGANMSSITDDATFEGLGIDSLSAIELKTDVEKAFTVEVPEEISLSSTIKEFLQALGFWEDDKAPLASHRTSKDIAFESVVVERSEVEWQPQASIKDPLQALAECDGFLMGYAKQYDFHRYWEEVAPRQDELMLAYIIEAFKQLGIDLSEIPAGQPVSRIQTAPRHDKVTLRLLEILRKHDFLRQDKSGYLRGRAKPPKSSNILQDSFKADFPAFRGEVNLMALTGPKLGDCLAGKADPVALMFKTAVSRKVMEEYYCHSPMLSTFTEHLVNFIRTLISKSESNDTPIRILEVGAGFGGTTMLLAQNLQALGVPIDYTFTDISTSLVNSAKNNFAQYGWMKFQAFNLEKEVPQSLIGRTDIVIGTNCVHATSSKTNSLRRLRQLLSPEGFVVLSEVTEIVDWYDIVFGLLDGWWLAEGYPLQPASSWMESFQEAGFASAGYSQSPISSLNTQRLLVGSQKKVSESSFSAHRANYDLHTIVYKTEDGIDIQADMYLPNPPPLKPMPMALMIHGGGHMTLSRRAIRPAQTEYLLANGILPISLDYRLCPETNLIDGPVADIREAYRWAKVESKKLLESKGINVDPTRIVVVGWSTGGHLAMTTAWTAGEIGLPPPTAILSFYGPIDFESGELDEYRAEMHPGRRLSIAEIARQLPSRPITNYNGNGTDSTGLGWVKPGDPRSELVLSLFKEGNGAPLLLNGLASVDKLPDPARVAYISPAAQLKAGRYHTPTYIIHGDKDEIVPWEPSKRFIEQLQTDKGVESGFLLVKDAIHIFDLKMHPGSKKWKGEVKPGYRFLIEMLKL